MLGAVAASHSDFGAKYERHVIVSAKHVAKLAYLVEHLIRCDPHKVWVHKLHDWPDSTVQGHSSSDSKETVLADRSSNNSRSTKLFDQPPCGTIGSPTELVNVFPHHDDALILLHAPLRYLCDCVNKANRILTLRQSILMSSQATKLLFIAANAMVDCSWVGPQVGFDNASPFTFKKLGRRGLHCLF